MKYLAYIAKGNMAFLRLLTVVFNDLEDFSSDVFSPDNLVGAIESRRPDLLVVVEDPTLYSRLKFEPVSAGLPVLYVSVGETEGHKLLDLSPNDRTWVLRNDSNSLAAILNELMEAPVGKRILCIDDSPTLLKQVKKVFSGTPYSVITAEHGRRGLEVLDHVNPDLIMTDVEMPVMDGITFCSKVRKRPSTAKTPLIILSSRVDHETIEAGFEAGADEYLTKPFYPDELLNKVESYLIPPPSRRTEQILAVSSSRNIGHHLSQAFSKQGFEFTFVSTWEDALDKAIELTPNLIVTDSTLDGASGFQLCTKIREIPGLKRVPVVVMNEKTSAGARKMGEKVGVSAYLTKPFTQEGLLVLVERLLAEHRTLQALEWDVVLASITSLARALDERDPYTRFHSENVARYAVAIGRKAGMDSIQLENLRLAGELHDIGKIGIPDKVLFKPGRLTYEEFEIIKEHPQRGAEILRPIPGLKPVVQAIHSHHERLDGDGYPDGLKGNDVPEFAQILAVADTFDALVTDRPYRLGMDHGKAIDIMRDVSGTQLSPQYVALFLQWLSESA